MIVSDPPVVQTLLQRVIDERVPLAVVLPGIDTPFDSLLLGIESSLGALLADELHPISGHGRIKPNTLLRIGARLDGVEVRFRTRVAAIDRDADIAAYLLDMPEEIDYRERRDTYRVKIPASIPLHWSMIGDSSYGMPLRARVVDLSLGGIGLALQQPHVVQVLDQTIGAVELPDGPLDVRIKIRYMRRSAFGAREDRAGGEFIAINSNDQRRLSRFAAEVQRPALRGRRAWIGREP
jgi:c-di-GMP-binding flagellar brake protein YcgR